MPKIETPGKGDCLPEDNVINTALAALKDAGCVNKTLKNEQEKNNA